MDSVSHVLLQTKFQKSNVDESSEQGKLNGYKSLVHLILVKMANGTKSAINEIWKRRSLIFTFAVTDLKLRYRNSFLGFLWSVAEPLLMLTVLYLVFTNIFKTQIENYVLYLLLGLVLWFFFNRATTMSLTSMIARKNIITKIYFPREILAVSSCFTALFMTIFEMGVFFLFMIPLQFVPGFNVFWISVVIILEFVLVLGISLPLSVLNARLHDIQHIWTVVLQAGFFLMPIIYKLDIFPQQVREIISYIPLVQILSIARQVVLDNQSPNYGDLLYLITSSIIVLIVGYIIFKKLEQRVVEEL